MRMKDVIISVTGVQQGVNGPDAMELVTAGQYGQDEKETLLTWQESELTGMEGTKTSLCVQPRSVVLSREGTLNTRMEFEEGRKRYFLYETPFGSATMGLNTRRIVNRLRRAQAVGIHGQGLCPNVVHRQHVADPPVGRLLHPRQIAVITQHAGDQIDRLVDPLGDKNLI